MATALVAFLDELRGWAADVFTKFADASPWPDAPYPPFSFVNLRAEELGAAAESLSIEEAVATLQGYLLGSPHDIAVRWTVFGAFHALAREGEDLDEAGGSLWDSTSDRYLAELTSAFAATVDVGTLEDPKAIGWEITNGCVLGQWNVVDDLFRRLEVLMPQKRGEHYALRGQLEFEARWSEDPREREPFHFLPALHVSASGRAMDLVRWAVREARSEDVDGLERLVSSGSESQLKAAAESFLASLEYGFSLPAAHRAVLARWLFDHGRPNDAAEHFSLVLQTGLGFEGANEPRAREVVPALYRAAANAHFAAGNEAKAVELLRQCAAEFPTSGFAYRRLAEHYAALTRYEDAFECLRDCAEADPEVQSDIWVRTLLAVGLAKPADRLRLIDEHFDAHPERLRFVEGAVSAHWSGLDGLSPESRHDWLRGSWMLWWSPPGWEWLDLAPVLFSRATERELRRAVFEQFVRESDRRLLTSVVGHQRKEKSRDFWNAALKDNVRSSLGEMLHEIIAARTSKDPLSAEFDTWIRKRLPGLALHFTPDDVAKIKLPRDRSAHASPERTTVDLVEEMCRTCQRLISLVQSPSSGGGRRSGMN